jgi:FlaA1/EpsC-like NDP-sugar epimerase
MKLAILGSGGHARSVAGVAVEELKLPVIAFIDVHSTENSSEKIYDLPVVSGAENIEITLQKLGVQGLILAVGDNQERDMLYTNLKGKYQFPNVISNSAILKKKCRPRRSQCDSLHGLRGPLLCDWQ